MSANTNNQKILLHRFLLDPKDFTVDHINKIPYDNRKNNLRLCTDSQNTKNKSINILNKTGVSGVCYLSKGGWESYIMVEGKNIHVYRGDNREEAIKARLEAEVKYYGEFAPQRDLFEQYNINGG